MATKISSSFCLALLVMVAQIHGDTWPVILTDVGNNDDLNTAPLLADLNSGLSPDTTGPNGWTALHIAAGLNKPNMAAALRDKGANLNFQDSFSHTPLHVAAGLNRVNVIRSLLPGADTEVRGPHRWTALHVAAGSDFNDAIRLLMKNSADPNAADSNGWTPLHIAVGTGHLGNVKAIISPIGVFSRYIGENYRAVPVDINAQDNKGYTPLHIATGNNKEDIARYLLSSEASTTILDNDGHTAKQVAAFLGYTNIVALFPEEIGRFS